MQKPCDKPPKHVFVLINYLADSTQDMSHKPIGNVCDYLISTSPEAVITSLKGGRQSCDERAHEFITNLLLDEILTRSVKVACQQWSSERILEHLLPSHVGTTKLFEAIGAIIHLYF